MATFEKITDNEIKITETVTVEKIVTYDDLDIRIAEIQEQINFHQSKIDEWNLELDKVTAAKSECDRIGVISVRIDRAPMEEMSAKSKVGK